MKQSKKILGKRANFWKKEIKINTLLKVLGGATLVLLFVGLPIWYVYSAITSFTKINYHVSTASLPTLTATPTIVIVPKTISLNIPQENDWIKYNPQCKPLKDNIEIYYPKDWIPNEFRVSDSDIDTSTSCQVIFGYKYKPGSYQNGDLEEVARMHVATWPDDSTLTAQEWVEQNFNPDETTGTIVINGVKFATKTDGDNLWFMTKKDNRFFEIQLISKTCSGNCYIQNRGIFDTSKDIINNGFTQRLKIIY